MPTFPLTRIALVTTMAAAGVAFSAQAQTFPERSFRASLSLGKEHSLGIALSKFAACAAQKTGGKMKITPYFDSQLGGDGPAIQQMRSGTLEAAVIATASTTAILPAAGIFDLPFLIQSEKEADQLLDGKTGEALTAKFPSVGLVNLSYWEYGYRQTTNSRRPIVKADDFIGVKMRVMPSPVMLDAFKNMGAISLTMPLTELYSAMETKAVDGQENPFSTIELNKFFEVQKYLSLTRHMYNPAMIVWSKQLWDKLTPPEQNALKQCGAESRDEQRRVNRQQNAESLERLRKLGIAINDVAPAEIAKMREKVQPLYDKQTASIGSDMMEIATAELKRIRGH